MGVGRLPTSQIKESKCKVAINSKSKGNLKIIDYIPHGHANAVTRQQLSSITGLSDRCVREMIEHESDSEHPILNMQDGKGYFQPEYDEMSLVRICIKQNESRAKSISSRNSNLKTWAKKAGNEVIRNQISIFDFIGGT